MSAPRVKCFEKRFLCELCLCLDRKPSYLVNTTMFLLTVSLSSSRGPSSVQFLPQRGLVGRHMAIQADVHHRHHHHTVLEFRLCKGILCWATNLRSRIKA